MVRSYRAGIANSNPQILTDNGQIAHQNKNILVRAMNERLLLAPCTNKQQLAEAVWKKGAWGSRDNLASICVNLWIAVATLNG
jgi:hypothetical protein